MKLCIICGDKFDRSNYDHLDLCSSQCFSANFWLEKVAWRMNGDKTEEGKRVARINGTHYVLGNSKQESKYRGCAGRRFVITFDTGDKVVCDDLWVQGEIPTRFKDLLPDNARMGC